MAMPDASNPFALRRAGTPVSERKKGWALNH
jgi:hypothetical protein